MKHDWRCGARFAALASLLVLSAQLSLCLAVESSQETSANSPAADKTLVVQLEYQEVTNSAYTWWMSPQMQMSPFAKEPLLAERKVKRGRLQFAGDKGQGLGFIWDAEPARLYLDLNRNDDLTDDTNGVFIAQTSTRSAGRLLNQDFRDVRLSLQTASGDFPMLFDLSMRDSGRLYVPASLRSFYAGKVTLAGQDWQVGIVESPHRVGSLEDASLLVRPWANRELAFQTTGGDLQAFALPKALFIGGRLVALVPTWEGEGGNRRCRLELVEKLVPLGELKITGQYIGRALLKNSERAVLLDAPAPSVSVPVGNYTSCRVHLQNGESRAQQEDERLEIDGGSSSSGASLKGSYLDQDVVRTMVVQTGKPATLAVGGPLTNTVTLKRRGNMLVLSHSLVGAGGETYELDGGRDSDHPPTWAIYRGDKQLATGKFEFG